VGLADLPITLRSPAPASTRTRRTPSLVAGDRGTNLRGLADALRLHGRQLRPELSSGPRGRGCPGAGADRRERVSGAAAGARRGHGRVVARPACVPGRPVPERTRAEGAPRASEERRRARVRRRCVADFHGRSSLGRGVSRAVPKPTYTIGGVAAHREAQPDRDRSVRFLARRAVLTENTHGQFPDRTLPPFAVCGGARGKRHGNRV
jgi:hypothetical protein